VGRCTFHGSIHWWGIFLPINHHPKVIYIYSPPNDTFSFIITDYRRTPKPLKINYTKN